MYYLKIWTLKRADIDIHSDLATIFCWFPSTRGLTSNIVHVKRKECIPEESAAAVTSVVSDSVRPHRQQPTRLHCPRDSPGKNIGVGCHFLLQCMKVKSEREVAQSCLTLSDPMDCSLPGSSVHGIFQARVLEWGAIAWGIYWRVTMISSFFAPWNYVIFIVI